MRWEVNAVFQYSTLLRNYSHGFVPGLDTYYVLEIRNTIHYHIMSLPTASDIPSTAQVSPVKYDACRLSLTIYSLLILFPVPLMTEPYPNVAQLLKSELESTQLNLSIWMPDLELLLWVLMMGGIAALGTADRWWYVQQLRWLAAILEIDSWEHLRLTMVSILWLDIPCDFEGLVLWKEVCTLG
jgi:hypothetical protein